jgi:hypothetical protein
MHCIIRAGHVLHRNTRSNVCKYILDKYFKQGMRLLSRMLRSKRDEVKGNWRRIHDEELYAPYPSPNIRLVRSRRMKLAGHVACVDDVEHSEVWWGNVTERDHLINQGVDGKIIWIFEK